MLTILGTPSRSSSYHTDLTDQTYHILARHALESCSYCTYHAELTDHTYHILARHALEKLLTVSSTEPVMVLQPTKPGTYQARYGRDIAEI